MMNKNKNLILKDNINMELLLNATKKPTLFTTNEDLFWDDPHIAQQMLKAHLNPTWDAASYNHITIDKIVEWLVQYLNLKEDSKILDLGCGPGLYCTRFFKHGINVVGMDYSRNSINYAKNYANTNGLNIHYIYQDYLTMDYSCEFDAIFLIYCDLGALSNSNRDLLLQKIQKALKPGGIFIFDAFTSFYWEQQPIRTWTISESGFWRPHPHLVLEQTFHYEEDQVFLHQHVIMDHSSAISTYNLYDHYYSKQDIIHLMKKHGYHVQDVWSDLTGTTYEEHSKCLGVAVSK